MVCANCKNWVLIPVQGHDRQDAAMDKLGFRNCLADKSKEASAKFIHGTATACEKFNVEVRGVPLDELTKEK